MKKYYKCLTKERIGGYSNFKWPAKGRKLKKINGDLELCKNGYHVCEAKDLLDWIGDGPVYEFIPDGEPLIGDNKVCFAGGKLGKKVIGDREHLLFQADVAQHVLHLFENNYPNDKRVRDHIQAKRDKANGLEVDWDASGAASRAASRAPSWDASWAASWDTSGAASRAASRAASWAASGAASWDASGDAEQTWQLRQLKYRMGILKTPAKGGKIYE